MHFMALKKSRKRFGFVISSYFKDSKFTDVKIDAKFLTRYVKGVQFSSGQRSADKMAAYFFALEEIVVNLSLVFCNV